MNTTLHCQNYSIKPTLYMAMELADKSWKLLFSNGVKQRNKTVNALDQNQLMFEIRQSKERLNLPADSDVIACYEAGWEGAWLARWLRDKGVTVHVVDSSAIEVNRRYRRAKTDRVDAKKLLLLLWRYLQGEKDALHVVNLPTIEDEDARRLHRERDVLVKERGRHWVRIKSLLRAQGLRIETKRDFLAQLDALRCWNGEPVPTELRTEIEREWARHELVDEQIRVLERQQKARVNDRQLVAMDRVRGLMALKSIGWQSAWLLVHELFAWRQFRNRRELASLVGLTPTPYSSGDSEREQGISKTGNRRVRTAMIELAWMWLTHQPDSALSQWFENRFAGGGKRLRRIGIVALARKLLVALWRYLTLGLVPEGAVLKH
jgi:transposase